ncbi:MAG: hypothetical protein L6W00_11035 [Lentisphaeria bacterium]|nr:MAG: hypothetical protein L6W00_11035 [Lentisphaeria bacterium]
MILLVPVVYISEPTGKQQVIPAEFSGAMTAATPFPSEYSGTGKNRRGIRPQMEDQDQLDSAG